MSIQLLWFLIWFMGKGNGWVIFFDLQLFIKYLLLGFHGVIRIIKFYAISKNINIF